MWKFRVKRKKKFKDIKEQNKNGFMTNELKTMQSKIHNKKTYINITDL